MKVMQKHIEFFQEEKYRDLEYGTIYYVAGTTTPHMNLEAKHSSRAFTKLINLNPEYWVNCKVVYLDSQNDLFISSEKATFYSALIPTADNLSQGYSFLVAELDECDKEVLFICYLLYFFLHSSSSLSHFLMNSHVIMPNRATQTRNTRQTSPMVHSSDYFLFKQS